MSPSLWQLLIVLALVILFFGKNRLPALGNSMREFMRQLKSEKDGRGDIDLTEQTRKNLKDREDS
ncbi:MAG: Sec-independent protein translocase TatA [Bdellovibrionales bacterium]|nr:Sec-independent protein translocase TatA [Bdellovibrionales bacterium]